MSPDKNTFLHITLDASDFLFPIEDVQEVSEMLPLKPYPVRVPGHLGVVNLRGLTVPVVSFKDHLLKNKNYSQKRLIVARHEGSLFGFLCTSVKKVVLNDEQIEQLFGTNVTNLKDRPAALLHAIDLLQKEAA